jgi:exportin-1
MLSDKVRLARDMTRRFTTEDSQNAGIRNFIVGVTVKVSSDETSLRREKTYVNKLNLALVQVRQFPVISIIN